MPEESHAHKRLKILPRKFEAHEKRETSGELPNRPESISTNKPKRRGKNKNARDFKKEFLAKLSARAPLQNEPNETADPASEGVEPSGPPESSPRDDESNADAASTDNLIIGELGPYLRHLGERKISVAQAGMVLGVTVFLAALFSATTAWNLGLQAGVRRLLDEQTKADVSVSEEFSEKLNRAFEDLRSGNPGSALKAFQELEAQNPNVSSMSYLIALSAMRSKNFPLAGEQAELSIRKRERVSDALAIQALLEVQKSEDPNLKKIGDHVLRAELLLRHAMIADPANPVPMIELAGFLRGQKKTEEAIALLKAARTRVQPFDLPPFLEATIVLASLQTTPNPELPSVAEPGENLPSAISAAYISMRQGHYDAAAATLRAIRGRIAPSFFRYLMNDPAMRPYSGIPELREFFY